MRCGSPLPPTIGATIHYQGSGLGTRAAMGSASRWPIHQPGTLMTNRYRVIAATVMGIAFAATQPSEARVVKFVVEQRTPFVGGAEWGNIGPYEMLRGTAYLEVNPRDPRDAVIVDLDKAPRDSHGTVSFSTQFLILKPIDPGRGNHKIFYAVNN